MRKIQVSPGISPEEHSLIKKLISIIPIVLVFFGTLKFPQDTDMGWHLKFGEEIARNFHFPFTNTYSWILPGIFWFNSSWATDVIRYVFYESFGFFGLAVLSALLICLTYYFIQKKARFSIYGQSIVVPLFLFLEYEFFNVSFRAQIISVLFLVLLFYLFHLFEKGKTKTILFTIPLFFVWANLHAQFLLGLGMLGLYSVIILTQDYFAEVFDMKKFLTHVKFLGGGLIASCLIVLINPYGANIFQESLNVAENPIVKNISEFLPLPSFTVEWYSLIVWGLILSVSLLVAVLNKKFSKYATSAILVAILFGLSLTQRRFAWSMYAVSLPLLAPLIGLLTPKKKMLVTSLTCLLFLGTYIVLFLKFPRNEIFNPNWDTYCKIRFCSPNSAKILSQIAPNEKIFTYYDWGGWLIWNYPKIKPGVDGRMSLWLGPNGESPFAEYLAYQAFTKDIEDSKFDIVYFPRERLLYYRLLQLEGLGKWRKVYSDDNSAIFVRTNKYLELRNRIGQ